MGTKVQRMFDQHLTREFVNVDLSIATCKKYEEQLMRLDPRIAEMNLKQIAAKNGNEEINNKQ